MSGQIPNSDYVPDPFPGVQAAGTPSPGSLPGRPAPPDDAVPGSDSGLPNVGTVVSLASQAGPNESASTSQPGQMAGLNALMGLDPGELSTTGAGAGNTLANQGRRFDWQQGPGGR